MTRRPDPRLLGLFATGDTVQRWCDACQRFTPWAPGPNGSARRCVACVRALTQRRGGELIEAIPNAKGGRGNKGGKRSQLETTLPRGVAYRWRTLLGLSETDIRAAAARKTDARQRLSLGELYGQARPTGPPVEVPGFPDGPFRTLVELVPRMEKVDGAPAAMRVSKSVEFCRRLQNLKWSHHQEVAGLEPAEQDQLLSAAAERRWTQRASLGYPNTAARPRFWQAYAEVTGE